jgi:hypothetical protein
MASNRHMKSVTFEAELAGDGMTWCMVILATGSVQLRAVQPALLRTQPAFFQPC